MFTSKSNHSKLNEYLTWFSFLFLNYSFETENGIKVEEFGVQKQIGLTPEESGSIAKGSYSYTAPDGTLIKVDWVADENGFQPNGAHIP